jgi:hypothetical protein
MFGRRYQLSSQPARSTVGGCCSEEMTLASRFETLPRLGMRGKIIETGVASAVHFAHAASTQWGLDFVETESRARGQGHNQQYYFATFV